MQLCDTTLVFFSYLDAQRGYRLSPGYAGASGRYAFATCSGSLHLTRYDYRPFRASAGQRTGLRRLGRPEEVRRRRRHGVGVRHKRFLLRSIFRTSQLSARISASEGRFYLWRAVEILTWRTYIKNSNCRAFICVKSYAATPPSGSNRSPHRFYRVDSQELKALKEL